MQKKERKRSACPKGGREERRKRKEVAELGKVGNEGGSEGIMPPGQL